MNERKDFKTSRASKGLSGLVAAAQCRYLEVTQELICQSISASYKTIVAEIQSGNVSLVNKICTLADMHHDGGLLKKYIELILPVYYCEKKNKNRTQVINGHVWKSRFFEASEEKMRNCLWWYSVDNFIDFETFVRIYYMCGGNTLFPLMDLSTRYEAIDWRNKIYYMGQLPKSEALQIRTILAKASLDVPPFSHYGYFVNGRLTTFAERRFALNKLIEADFLNDRDIMVSDSMLKKLGPADSLKRLNCMITFMQKHLGKHCARAKKFIPPEHIQAWRDDIQYLEMQKTTIAEEDTYCV